MKTVITIRDAKEKIKQLVADLRAEGYNPSRAILFGSVAKETATPLSDIDLALWDSRFEGCAPFDYENILSVLRNYPRIELHTFNSDETAESNPSIREIEKSGIEIEIGA